MSIQAQTALLARVTGRPVRLVLSREESMRLHPKRHPIRMHYRVGCDAEGRLTAVRARMIGDSGAYASVGMQGARARGRPRGRAVQVPERGRRGAGRLHEQPALRRHARLRREPGPLRDGGRARHARREGRPRRLGDQVAKRARGGRRVVVRAEAHGFRRPQEDAPRRQGRLGEEPGARGHRLRHQELRHRKRAEGMGTGAARRGGATAASRSTTATPRWARASSRS